jgi:DNA topoisomerase-1
MRPHLNIPAVEAATTRRIVDRLAGWHATAVVFEKLRKHRGLSAGRLQSAALRLVVERHREHESFRPSTTFGVRLRLRSADGTNFAAVLLHEDGRPRRFPDRSAAEAHAVPAHATARSVDAERKSQKPRPPFDAPSWLQVAQRALGLSVKDATLATQTLFERGLTTYPRTDTVRVSDEAVERARSEIARRFGREYVPDEPWVHRDSAG